VLIEAVFNLGGFGQMLVSAVNCARLLCCQDSILIIISAVIIMNLLVDVFMRLLTRGYVCRWCISCRRGRSRGYGARHDQGCRRGESGVLLSRLRWHSRAVRGISFRSRVARRSDLSRIWVRQERHSTFSDEASPATGVRIEADRLTSWEPRS